MTTVMLWLLVSLTDTTYGGPRPAYALVERFAVAAECERVREVLTKASGQGARLMCVQATVVR